MPDRPLSPARIRARLTSGVFGRRLYYMPEVDSTNRVAKGLALEGERHGAVVVTDYQSAGRGRRKRSWASPPRRNLLLSLVLRPERTAAEVLPLTLEFSLVIADVLGARCGCEVRVKWPNDVVTHAGKLCGILSESTTRDGRTAFVIVGMGVNVNMRADEFPEGMEQPGASCYTLTSSELDREELLADLLRGLEAGYTRFLDKGFGASLQRYTDRCTTLGREVPTTQGPGRAVGVCDDGGLRVAVRNGEEVVVYDVES